MTNKLTYPILQPSGSNTFSLVTSYRYLDIIIPLGFETNGGDVPRIFWSIIPPFKPKFLPAIVLHDYLISTASCKYDIIKANEVFKEVLFKIEKSFKTKCMVLAVNFYWKYIKNYK